MTKYLLAAFVLVMWCAAIVRFRRRKWGIVLWLPLFLGLSLWLFFLVSPFFLRSFGAWGAFEVMENLALFAFDIPLILVWVGLIFVRPINDEVTKWLAAVGFLVSPAIYFVLFLVFTEQFSVRIIDQNSKSIEGCIVNCTLKSRCPLYFWSVQRQGITDSNGVEKFRLFPFQSPSTVPVAKNGYRLNFSSQEPTQKQSVLFRMWKFRGAEPLVGSSIDTKIPHDGSPVTFEVQTGKISPDGDLRVTLSQFPLEIRTGREKFDWMVKVEILNGGLIEESDSYPYWAPANDYQPSFEFNMVSNAVKWLPNLKKNFYIKNAQGQYGIMQFGVYPGRSPTGLQVDFTINPSGSQNLEPDLTK